MADLQCEPTPHFMLLCFMAIYYITLYILYNQVDLHLIRARSAPQKSRKKFSELFSEKFSEIFTEIFAEIFAEIFVKIFSKLFEERPAQVKGKVNDSLLAVQVLFLITLMTMQ